MDRTRALEAFHAALSAGGASPPAEQWPRLADRMQLRSYDKNDFVLQSGTRPKTIAFVVRGLLRMFYSRADGKVFNKSFIRPPDFVGALESLIAEQESRLSIQCLEATTLLEVDYAYFRSLYEQDMFWQRLGRVFVEKLYIKKAQREASFLMDPAKVRYEQFLADYADVEDRLPDYHIASYLGITPEALSRLKKARAKTKIRS